MVNATFAAMVIPYTTTKKQKACIRRTGALPAIKCAVRSLLHYGLDSNTRVIKYARGPELDHRVAESGCRYRLRSVDSGGGADGSCWNDGRVEMVFESEALGHVWRGGCAYYGSLGRFTHLALVSATAKNPRSSR
jgi:hypothetical protein